MKTLKKLSILLSKKSKLDNFKSSQLKGGNNGNNGNNGGNGGDDKKSSFPGGNGNHHSSGS